MIKTSSAEDVVGSFSYLLNAIKYKGESFPIGRICAVWMPIPIWAICGSTKSLVRRNAFLPPA